MGCIEMATIANLQGQNALINRNMGCIEISLLILPKILQLD